MLVPNGNAGVRLRQAPELALRRDGTYLVTGGIAGFGFAAARWLAANGRDFDVINMHSSTDSWLSALACRTLRDMPPLVRTRHVSTAVHNTLPTRWLYRRATAHIVTAGEALTAVNQRVAATPGLVLGRYDDPSADPRVSDVVIGSHSVGDWGHGSGPSMAPVAAVTSATAEAGGDRLRESLLVCDTGGTTFDVGLVNEGEINFTAETWLGGKWIGHITGIRSVDVKSIGAGGGSIAWIDAGGLLRVGPHSAGADPGPACYGRGGERATVTDANLLLGRLPGRLAGGLELDVEAAERALARVGAAPEDVIEVVNAEMLAALRVVSVERGLDPRDFALVAFGGAGALHACALADELEIGTVLVPEAAGVLSALGLALSDERRDEVRSLVVPLEQAGELPREGEADVRYVGQSFELPVPLGGDVAEAFHRAHEERYGYADRTRPLELVALRTARVRAGPRHRPARAPTRASETGLVELDGSSAWIPPGWRGGWRGGSLVVTRT